MKKISAFKTIRIWMLLFLFPGLVLVSCEDDTDDMLPPVIHMIRTNVPEEGDIPIDDGGLGQTIVIVGDHFQTLKKIYINELLTDFLPTFVTRTHIVITIDDETPTIATDPDATNTIRLVNAAGETTRDFNILPPPPLVYSICKEFAQPGDSLTIEGLYFYFVEEVAFPGEIISTEFVSSADGRTIRVKVPEGITEAGTVEVITRAGSDNPLPLYRFNDREGMFCDFDDINTFAPGDGDPPEVVNEPDPVDGYYVKMQKFNIPAPMWWDGDNTLNLFFDVEEFNHEAADPSEFSLKFEFNTAVSIKSGWFEMRIYEQGEEGYFYRFMPWNTPSNPEEYWNIGTRHDFYTDGWKTMIVPLNLFREKPENNPDGDTMTSVSELKDMNRFVMAFQNHMPPMAEPISELHLWFDNFRIVRISNQAE